MIITIVTGNANKLAEIQKITPAGLELTNQKIDVDEIQSLDLHAIVEHKLRQAYGVVKGPVVVEDVSAGLASLNGLPGPFIKFFEQELGRGALYRLTKATNDRITIRCSAGYYDGNTMLFGEGIIEGTIVEPRGENGFGFDCVTMPDGYDRTMAEMTAEEKNSISHRGKAFEDLFSQITSLVK